MLEPMPICAAMPMPEALATPPDVPAPVSRVEPTPLTVAVPALAPCPVDCSAPTPLTVATPADVPTPPVIEAATRAAKASWPKVPVPNIYCPARSDMLPTHIWNAVPVVLLNPPSALHSIDAPLAGTSVVVLPYQMSPVSRRISRP